MKCTNTKKHVLWQSKYSWGQVVKTKGGNRRGKVRKINERGKKKEDTERNEGCLRPRTLFACCPFVERESAGRKEGGGGRKRGIIPFVSCGDKGQAARFQRSLNSPVDHRENRVFIEIIHLDLLQYDLLTRHCRGFFLKKKKKRFRN